MENNKPGLEKPHMDTNTNTDMSADELKGIAADKLTTAEQGTLAAEAWGSGLAGEPAPVESAPSDAVYTAKDLFSVSPAMRAKHFWGLLVLRAFFALIVLSECLYIFMIFAPGSPGGLRLMFAVLAVFKFFILFVLWYICFWPYVVAICLNVLFLLASLSSGSDVVGILVGCIILGMQLVAAAATWGIHEDLRRNRKDDRPLEQESESTAPAFAEDSDNFSANTAWAEVEAEAAPASALAASAASPVWPPAALTAELQTPTGQAAPPAAAPQEKPQGSDAIYRLIVGVAIAAAVGALLMCLHFYEKNQRREKGFHSSTTSDVNVYNSQADVSAMILNVKSSNLQADASATAVPVKTFALQNGISILLPKSWNVFESKSAPNTISAQRYDLDGSFLEPIS